MIVAKDVPKRPVLRYYGGKWKLAPWIISHFPSHKNYVEPCGGAASVLLQKPRSPLEIYNDLDGSVVNFFQVLRDKPDELIYKIRLTPWARAEYELSQSPMSSDCIEQARRFFVLCWQAIGGQPSGWRCDTTAKKKDGNVRWGNCATNFSTIWNKLNWIAERLKFVQIDNRPYQEILSKYDNTDSLIYFDPPYVPELRTFKQQYAIEWIDQDHTQAAGLLRQVQGYVVVSGYACPLYTELYENHDWQRFDKEAQTSSGGKRVESIWLSPRTVEALSKPQQLSLLEGRIR